MNRILAIASLLLALAAPAAATESIVCASEDQSASIDVLVGLGLDVVSIDRVTVEAKGKTWATNVDGEHKIVVGQAFEDGEKLLLDLTAEGMDNVDKIKRGEPVKDPDKIVSMKIAADAK